MKLGHQRRSVRNVAGIFPILASFLVMTTVGQEPGTKVTTAHIEGIVLEEQTDEPLQGVRISEATTGSDGSFALDLPVRSSCRGVGQTDCTVLPTMLVASKPGYTPGRLDGTRIGGISLSLVPGERIENLTIRMARSAAITGRVLNSRGQPMERVEVIAFRLGYDDAGARQRMDLPGSSRPITTNDLGEFRLDRGGALDSGEYYLEFRPPELLSSLPDAAGKALATTYYPGTPDLARAETVRAESGVSTRVRDVVFEPIRCDPLKVRIVNETGELPRGSIAVSLFRQGEPRRLRAVTLPGAANNSAELGCIGPGGYEVRASFATPSSGFNEGRASFESGMTDIALAVPVRKIVASQISGQAVVMQPNGESRPASNVRLVLSDSSASSLTASPLIDARSAWTSQSDGSFEQRTVLTGASKYRFTVIEPPPGLYVTAITNGTDDLLREGLNLESGRAVRFSVLLAESAGVLRGIATTSRGVKTHGGVAVLIPENPQNSKELQTAPVDLHGTFKMQAAPGAYRLYVWRELWGAAYLNTEFMRTYEDRGRRVVVGADKEIVVSLAVLD